VLLHLRERLQPGLHRWPALSIEMIPPGPDAGTC